MTTDFKYLASFKLYDPDGLSIFFHVGGDEQEPHVADTLAYLARLKALGLDANPPGETPGAQVESIDAYVMGETSKGDACVYLYSSDHRLQFKYATVYVERFGDLPFKPTGQVWPGSAPMRDDAERKKYLVDVPEFEIVLEPQFNSDGTPRLSDKGKPIYEFARVKAALPIPEPPQPATAVAAPPATASNASQPAEPPAAAAQAPSAAAADGALTESWTSEKAETWAVKMGAYTSQAEAAVALKSLYNANGKPAKAALWKLWSEQVSHLVDVKLAAEEQAGTAGR